jgi:acyl-CoA hydrolase
MERRRLSTPGPVTTLGLLVRATHANYHDTLFGGEALKLMDEVASVAAARYAAGPIVTAHVDAVDFTRPIPVGSFVEARARVIAIGRSSMEIEVELWAEERTGADSQLATSGRFVCVAVDPSGHPRSLPKIRPR